MTEKYNGWTNYATWRINLEILENYLDADEYSEIDDLPDVGDLAEQMESHVDELLEMGCENQTTLSYANAFTNDVNYHEIAKGQLDDVKKELKLNQ